MAEVTGLRNNALPYPVYGAPFGVTFPILDADGDLVTGAAGLDSERSLNGDTFADCTNEATEIATSSGVYYLLLTAAEMTADVVSIIVKTSTTGAKTAVITLYPRKLVTLRAGTAQGGAAGSITLDASAYAIDDAYNGCLVVGVLDGTTEARIITDYVGSTKVASVTPNWNTTPDSDDTFTIYMPEGMQIKQADIQAFGGTAGTFSGGRPEVNTTHAAGTAWGSGAITASAIASDAITAAKIADGAIDAGALAADAGTEIATAVWASSARTLTAATNITSTGGTTVPQTGDSFARIGAPTGASVSADIASLLSAGAPVSNAATSSVETYGTVIGGTYATTATKDSSYFILAPVAVNGIDSYLQFTLAANQTPTQVQIFGRFASASGRLVHVYAYNWNTASWDRLSNPTTAMIHRTTDTTYAFTINTAHQDATDRYIRIRFVTTETNTSYRLNLDRVIINSIAEVVATQVGGAVDVISFGGTAVTLDANGLPAVNAADIGGAASAGTAGYVGPDWSNIAAPTTAVNLSGTTIKTATDVETDTADIQSRLPAALVSGRIDASAGALAANVVTAGALAADAGTEIGAAVWVAVLETGFSADRILRIIAAATAGESTGGPGSPIYRNLADTQDQISGTANSSGDRSAITYGA